MFDTAPDHLKKLADIEKSYTMHDLEFTVHLTHHENYYVKQRAKEITVKIIRESIIDNFNKIELESRKKLAKIIDLLAPDFIEELIKKLHSSNEETRIHSLMILGLFRRDAKIKIELEKLLKSRNDRIKATAIQAIGNYPDDSEYLMLMKQLSDRDNRIRANAIEALEKFDNSKLRYTIKRYVHDGNNRIRANALKAIYVMGDHNIDFDVMQMLKSRDHLMVASGCWLISQISFFSDSILKRCRQCYMSEDCMVKRNAEYALQRFLDDGKIDTLYEYIEDDDEVYVINNNRRVTKLSPEFPKKEQKTLVKEIVKDEPLPKKDSSREIPVKIVKPEPVYY